MTRTRATLALAATAAAVAAVPTAASAAPLKGLQDQPLTIQPSTASPATRTTFLASAKALKVKFTRVTVRWDGKSTVPFGDEVNNIKSLLQQAPAYGVTNVEIVPSVASNNSYNPKGRKTPPTAKSKISTAAYSTWIANLATALKNTPGVTKYYTPLNEPNWYRFLPRRGNTTVYRTLVKTAYTNIKAIDPSAKVLFGELLPYARPKSKSYPHGQSQNPGSFMRGVLGLKSNWKKKGSSKTYTVKADGVALHTYDFKANPKKLRRGSGSKDIWTQANLRYASKYVKLAKKSKRINSSSIFLTEFAYKTKGPDKIPTSRAKSYLKSSWSIAKKYKVKSFLWYQLRDKSGDIWQSGLQKSGGSKYGTYNTFKALK